jgi:hypothetical protein
MVAFTQKNHINQLLRNLLWPSLGRRDVSFGLPGARCVVLKRLPRSVPRHASKDLLPKTRIFSEAIVISRLPDVDRSPFQPHEFSDETPT